MPVTVTINKSEYTFPSAGDAPGWGEAATTVIQALAANKLDKSAFWKDADPMGYQILDDDGYMVIGTSIDMAIVKLPEAAKNPGRIIYVYKKSGRNSKPNVEVKPGSGDSIVGSSEGSCLGFVSDGTSSWINFLSNTILEPLTGNPLTITDNSSHGVKASWIYDHFTNSGTAKDVVEKVSGATNGNFAGLDGDGALTDSGVAPADKLSVADLDDTPADDADTATASKWVYDNLTDSGTVKPFVQRAAIETRTNTNGQIADTAADKTVIMVHTDGGAPMVTTLPDAANNEKIRLTFIRDPSSTSITALYCPGGNTFGDGSTTNFNASVSGGAWTFESDGVSKWICVSSHDGTLP